MAELALVISLSLAWLEFSRWVESIVDGREDDREARSVLLDVAREEAEFEARAASAAKSFAEMVHGMLAAARDGATTPGCDCDYCTTKRAAAQKVGN